MAFADFDLSLFAFLTVPHNLLEAMNDFLINPMTLFLRISKLKKNFGSCNNYRLVRKLIFERDFHKITLFQSNRNYDNFCAIALKFSFLDFLKRLWNKLRYYQLSKRNKKAF